MSWKYWILGCLFAVGLVCTWPITRAVTPSAMQGTSSNVSVLLVSLGGARGILTELLWWRINELQRQGRNAEVYPLTQLLTELDPSTPNVAVFNAWNCAYNIACTYDNPEDRWLWMKRGHAILEDGLQQYPDDSNALREMVAFWQLKFYGNIDPFQSIFHQRVAEIPMSEKVRAVLRAQGLPEDPRVPALRLYAWAHHAHFDREERFALLRLLEMTPQSDLFHKAFADAYSFALHDDRLTNYDIKNYQTLAKERLKRFPQDPYLQRILKEPL